MTEYRRRDRDYEPRRGAGLGGLFVRLVVGLVILGAVAAAALVYLGKSDEGVVEDMASGLDAVADRLEQDLVKDAGRGGKPSGDGAGAPPEITPGTE